MEVGYWLLGFSFWQTRADDLIASLIEHAVIAIGKRHVDISANRILMRNFRNMIIWNQGIDLSIKGYSMTRLLPKEETYGLRSQINRALVSIPSNIAEGCSRTSDKEFCRFLEISLGSSFELETDLIIVEKLGMIKSNVVNEYLDLLKIEQKQINSLINKLK